VPGSAGETAPHAVLRRHEKGEDRAQSIARKTPHKLDEYLARHTASIVVGPGGVPYVTDGHHLALWKSKAARTLPAEVKANWRDLTPAQFWARMRERNWAYLYDYTGKGPLDPARLPADITGLADDPYRSLV